MYIEIKTDEPRELTSFFGRIVEKGHQSLMTLSKDGDFVSLSVNELTGPTADELKDAP